jgi:site-specific recombinase XerD
MGYTLRDEYSQVYEEFLDYEKPRVSKQGYDTIKKNTRRLLKWFEGEDIALEDTTIRDALRYRNETAENTKADGSPLSTGTVQNRMKAGKTFFGYLVTAGRRETNPFKEVPYPRIHDHLSRNGLNETQMGELLDALLKFDEKETYREKLASYRLHVAAEFLYATGMRIAEAAGLVPSNIDTSSRLVYIPEGKGRKSRKAFMTGFAAEVMEQYLKRGREIVLGNFGRTYGETVFGAHPQRIMSVVNQGLAEVCAELKLPLITSHGFRHSLGTHLLRAGCDMRHIQAILGHERLSTTQVYTRVDKDDLRQSLDIYHPRKEWKI